jgi:hypothetical protein
LFDSKQQKEVAMSKMPVVSKVIALAVVVALVLAALPTVSVYAGATDPNTKLEAKWEQLVENYNRQSLTHKSAHNWADVWFKDHKDATASQKAKIQRHLDICNSALATAQSIVSVHAGFDMKGKVVDRASAITSIKQLGFYLRQHAGSVKNLGGHVN